MYDQSILPNYNIYMGSYYHHDIKREEIKLLANKDNLFLFQFEYFTSTVDNSDEVDFSKSKQNKSKTLELNEESIKNEEEAADKQNIITSDNLLVDEMTNRPVHEKEILIKNMSNLVKGIKVVFQDSNFVDSHKSTLLRYVLFNSKFLYF